MTLYFTKDHEWVRVEGDSATVGISDHAQEALGDIVFVEVPEAGKQVRKGQEAAVVESVKAASDVYGEGWFFKLKLSNASELESLMDETAYREWVRTL